MSRFNFDEEKKRIALAESRLESLRKDQQTTLTYLSLIGEGRLADVLREESSLLTPVLTAPTASCGSPREKAVSTTSQFPVLADQQPLTNTLGPLATLPSHHDEQQAENALQPLLAQLSQQIAANQILLAQHERENSKLQQELDTLLGHHEQRVKEQQGDTTEDGNTEGGIDREGLSARDLHLNDLFADDLVRIAKEGDEDLARLGPNNPDVAQWHKQHVQEMLQLRYEAEKTILQSRVDRLKLMAEREKGRLEREKLAEEQGRPPEKKPVPAPSQEKTKAEAPKAEAPKAEAKEPPPPDDTFVIYWDVCLGLPTTVSQCRVVFGCYAGSSPVGALKVVAPAKTLPQVNVNDMPAAGNSSAPLHQAVFGACRPFSKVEPSSTTRIVVEVQSVAGAGAGEAEGAGVGVGTTDATSTPAKVQSLGWSVVDLYLPPACALQAGRWRVPLYKPPVRLSSSSQDLTLMSSIPNMELFFRIAPGSSIEPSDRLSLNPSNRAKYSLPWPYSSASPVPQRPSPPLGTRSSSSVSASPSRQSSMAVASSSAKNRSHSISTSSTGNDSLP